MKKVIFREATLNDVNSIAELHHKICNNQPESFMDKLGVRFLKKYYRIILTIDETFVILAHINDKLVGFHSGTLNYGKQLDLLNKKKFSLGMNILIKLVFNPFLLVEVLKRFLNTSSNLKYYDGIPRGEYWAWDKDVGFPVGSLQMHKKWHQKLLTLGFSKVRSEINLNNKKVLKLAKSLGAKEIDSIIDQSGNSRLILEYNLHKMRYPI